MYIYAVRNFSKIKSITHKYLVTGHTQNEGDNAHSLIERNVKRALRSGPICLPEQYVTLIRTAKKTGTPYSVEELTYDEFSDLKNLAHSIGIGPSLKLKISDLQLFEVTKEYPYKIFYNNSYGKENFEKVEFGKARNSRGRNTESVTLLKAYKDKIGITEDKKKFTVIVSREIKK